MGFASGFSKEILREYDIRGQIGRNLSEDDAYLLGLSFSDFLRAQNPEQRHLRICVGYDGRLSSPALHQALIDGLKKSGIHVIDIGLGPTPMLYFSVKHLNADAGIMVTGSHNPPDYNGFKMTLNAYPVFGKAIQDIGRIAQNNNFPNHPQGSCEQYDIEDIYIERLLRDLTLKRPLSIAWDCGNGAAGQVLQKLCQKIDGHHTLLFEKIDGTFPNHHPDPTVDSNLVDLRRAVLSNQSDLGIAFDGDGDRIGVIDDKGEILRCDTLLMIYAREVLQNYPGATIIGDVKCSALLFDEIQKLGGQPLMWKTGHSVMKDKMRDTGAPLAGELSGHIFFGDKYYGFDDALYCAIRLMNAMENRKLSELTDHLPKLINTPEIRFEVNESEKFDLIERLKRNLEIQNVQINTTDGLRVTTEDGWFLIRASNTQNCLTTRMESTSSQGLNNLIDLVDEEVKKLGYSLPL